MFHFGMSFFVHFVDSAVDPGFNFASAKLWNTLLLVPAVQFFFFFPFFPRMGLIFMVSDEEESDEATRSCNQRPLDLQEHALYHYVLLLLLFVILSM